jgi:polyisoprenyl-teichoic acid--peptidoglycan teichoic acid transferase
MKLNRTLKLIYVALIAGTAVTYFAAAFTIYNLQLLPNKYLLPALALGNIIMLIVLIVAWRGRRSGKVRITISLVCIVIIALSAYAYNTGRATASFLSNISTAGSSDNDVDATKPFIIYISGIDSTEDPMSNARSDVNILAVVNPTTNRILLVNTPRDYYVTLSEIGAKDKLTHAGLYGVDTSRDTLEDLFDTPINYYLRVNFSSLVNTIDVIGDIDVYSDYDFAAYNTTFKQGYNTLNSEQALEFSRNRYAFEDGDRTRGKNQQRVIEAIITKMSTPGALVNYKQILTSLQGSLQTDMGTNSIAKLVKSQQDNTVKWSVESISVNGTDSHNVTYSTGNTKLYVMEPNITSINEAKQKILQYQ